MTPQKGTIYLLYHPSWSGAKDPDKNEVLYDIVTAEFDGKDRLSGWRVCSTGVFEPLAVKGYEPEWQDRITPLPLESLTSVVVRAVPGRKGE